MLVPCKACGGACSTMCDGLTMCLCPDNRPSPMFTLFSCIINGVLLLFAVLGLTAGTGDPPSIADASWTNTWLGVTMGIAGLNIVFALYLYWKFSRMTSMEGGEGRLGAASAAWKLCMYDIGVFLYLLICVFIMVWTFIGADCKDDYLDDCDTKEARMKMCRILLWIYLVLGGFIVALSLCTECCKPSRSSTSHHHAAPPPNYQSYPANGQSNPPQQQYHQQPPPQQPPPQQYQQQAYPQAPPPQQYQQPPPPQQQQYQQQQQQPQYGGTSQTQGEAPTMAQKAGNAVGGVLGKGLNALKK